MEKERRNRIMIVDDSDINRQILAEMLENLYDIVEARDGHEAIAALRGQADIDLILLDIFMPDMDGYEVLTLMNKYHWIEQIPVMMISASQSTATMERAYQLGATDFIRRPFDRTIIIHRINNTLKLYDKHRWLAGLVERQVYDRERNNRQMIDILGHIVEFRNGESGLHIEHIQTMTRLLLRALGDRTDRYPMTDDDILLISSASALHDIGKIAIDEAILNKPGKLTPEEYEIMKTHAAIGADMIDKMRTQQPGPRNARDLVNVAYEICRWHHERYDGHGYPDGLKGEEIPISAQVVALADVYDALTSERCYKEAVPHEKAVRMILDGACGVFNPILLDCLLEIAPHIQEELRQDVVGEPDRQLVSNVTQKLLLPDNSRERNYNYATQWEKIVFFSEGYQEIQFTYDALFDTLALPPESAKFLGLPNIIIDPRSRSYASVGGERMEQILQTIHAATPEQPLAEADFWLKVGDGVQRWHLRAKTLWSRDVVPRYLGVWGRMYDLESHRNLTVSNDSVRSVSRQELDEMMFQLRKIFDIVRLVDARGEEMSLNEEQICAEGKCYAVWDRDKRCENCASAMALRERGKRTKLEMKGDELYQVVAKYVEVDGVPYVMEMVQKVSGELMLDSAGQNNFVNEISRYNRMLYIDPVTETYNRRYYEQCAKQMTDIRAVAMLDGDHFKAINDTYGHAAGDEALLIIAKAIQVCIRTTDHLIRYGGDEFILLMPDIPREAFRRKLEYIVGKVRQAVLPECPDAVLAVTIGATYGEGMVSDLLHVADRAMYKGKRTGKSVVIQ